MYAVLARLFAYPHENLKNYCRTALKINALPEKMKKLLSKYAAESLAAIQAQYVATFNHTQSETPLYETFYTYTSPFQQANELADISGFYGAFGLKLADTNVERHDHISTELEFMSFMILRIANENDPEKRGVLEDAAKKFLNDHLGRWAPVFGEMLATKGRGGLYAELGALLKEFAEEEDRRFGINPKKLRGIDARVFSGEPEGGCFSCQLNQNGGE